uniref:Serpentine receptor class gamma n=1 Tax=Rhabditophanes sp. KR3021 TaxID=114890 RepID=A0AC35U3B6_9BILA
MFIVDSKPVFLKDSGYHIYQMVDSNISWINTSIMTFFSTLVALVSLVLNVINIKKYNKIMKSHKSKYESAKAGFYIMYCAILNFGEICFASLYIFRMYYLIVGDSQSRAVVSTFTNYSASVITLVQPIAILLLNRPIRKIFYQFMTFHKPYDKPFSNL